MSKNCDVFVVFSIYGQFGTIRKPYSERIVCKTYIFVNSNLYITKTENRTQKSLTQLSYYCFEERYYFSQRTLIFGNPAPLPPPTTSKWSPKKPTQMRVNIAPEHYFDVTVAGLEQIIDNDFIQLEAEWLNDVKYFSRDSNKIGIIFVQFL